MGTKAMQSTKALPVAILAVSLCMAALGTPALAEKGGSKAAAQRAALIAGLERGRSFAVNGEEYEQLPGVAAIERRAHSDPAEQALARIGAERSTLIETKGRYVVFHRASAVSGAQPVRPTVLNRRTGTIGILPGTIVVQPRDMGDIEAIAARHGLSVARSFSHLNTVFLSVAPGADAIGATLALRSDPDVMSARPEIVEHAEVAR